jgi:hypothetical protein
MGKSISPKILLALKGLNHVHTRQFLVKFCLECSFVKKIAKIYPLNKISLFCMCEWDSNPSLVGNWRNFIFAPKDSNHVHTHKISLNFRSMRMLNFANFFLVLDSCPRQKFRGIFCVCAGLESLGVNIKFSQFLTGACVCKFSSLFSWIHAPSEI